MAGGIDWFRWHHGSVTDPKFQLVAKRCSASVAEVIAVWATLLESASQHVTRGHAGSQDFESLDCALGLDDGKSQAIYLAMQARGLIDESGSIHAWDRRQPKREDDGAIGRKRLQRERNKAELGDEKPVLSRNVTQCHDRGEESRVEKNSSSLRSEESAKRKRSTSPPDGPDDVSKQVWEDWLTLRRKKSAPVTTTVLESARSESAKAGMSFEAFLTVWCARGSQGLQADWLKLHERPQSHSPPPAETTYQRSMRQKVESICPSIAAKPPNHSETIDVTAKTLGREDFCEADPDLRPRLSVAMGGT